MVSEGVGQPGVKPRSGGLGVRLQGGSRTPVASVPALPAIYLAKKSIRKQGALVTTRRWAPFLRRLSPALEVPGPTCGPGARGATKEYGRLRPPELGAGGRVPLEDLDPAQEQYHQLRRRISHAWDLVMMQARGAAAVRPLSSPPPSCIGDHPGLGLEGGAAGVDVVSLHLRPPHQGS